MTNKKEIQNRLNYLRQEIEQERISYGEIIELQSLSEHIDTDDNLLLEWAGVPEFTHDYKCDNCGKPATRNIQGTWVEYPINKDGEFEKHILGDSIDDMSYFYCDDCE